MGKYYNILLQNQYFKSYTQPYQPKESSDKVTIDFLNQQQQGPVYKSNCTVQNSVIQKGTRFSTVKGTVRKLYFNVSGFPLFPLCQRLSAMDLPPFPPLSEISSKWQTPVLPFSVMSAFGWLPPTLCSALSALCQTHLISNCHLNGKKRLNYVQSYKNSKEFYYQYLLCAQ